MYSSFIGSGLCVFSRHRFESALLHRFSLNGYPQKVYHSDWLCGKGVALVSLTLTPEATASASSPPSAEHSAIARGNQHVRPTRVLLLTTHVRIHCAYYSPAICSLFTLFATRADSDANVGSAYPPHCTVQCTVHACSCTPTTRMRVRAATSTWRTASRRRSKSPNSCASPRPLTT